MKSIILVALLTMTGTLSAISVAAPSVDADTSHAGAFVDDSIITIKVKAKLAEKHMSSLTEIKVDTDSAGVVWLSGKAPTQDASDLAGMIAKDTDGVKKVHNQIVVQE
jgi:hyperosmotically inducible protein